MGTLIILALACLVIAFIVAFIKVCWDASKRVTKMGKLIDEAAASKGIK